MKNFHQLILTFLFSSAFIAFSFYISAQSPSDISWTNTANIFLMVDLHWIFLSLSLSLLKLTVHF